MKRFKITAEEQWYTIPSEYETICRRIIGNRRKGKIKGVGFYVTDSNEIKLISKFLVDDVEAYYHEDYRSGSFWSIPNTIENMIWTLKNDVHPFPDRLGTAIKKLAQILYYDLSLIYKLYERNNFTVCVVPRAKAEEYYRSDQLYFKLTIKYVIHQLGFFEDGIDYIRRHTNTRTTHLDKTGGGGDGDLPYPGITKDTCTISKEVRGKKILLIDDLYTKGVNIDEDAIQTLLDEGASSVIFYSIGKTLSK